MDYLCYTLVEGFGLTRLYNGSKRTISTCNGPDSPLADIVLFGLSLSGFSLEALKRVWEGFHTLIKGVMLSSPTNVGLSQFTPSGQHLRWHFSFSPIDVVPPPNPPPFGAQRLYWHTVSCLPSSGNSEKASNLLVVDFHCYKWYQSQTLNGMPSRTLCPQKWWIVRSHIGWRRNETFFIRV